MNICFRSKVKFNKGSKSNQNDEAFKSVGGVTTSNVPGTTLGVIEVDLGDGKVLYDTPGLILEGSFLEWVGGEEVRKRKE